VIIVTRDEAQLLYFTKSGTSTNGFTPEVETAIDVDVEIKSVGRTEAYLAMQSDRSPTIIFRLRLIDWELSKHAVDGAPRYAEKVRYDGYVYNIIRHYSADGYTELTCG